MTADDTTQTSLADIITDRAESTDDDDSDESYRYVGLGGSRHRYLDAIDEKDKLDPVENPESIEDVIQAVKDISLGKGVMNPPKKPIETIRRVHSNLPDEAKEYYINDPTLLQRINAARRQFNEWIGRKKRESQMPGPYEAGPSKYPTKKLRKRQRSERNAYDELQEKIDRVRSGANGAKRRALNAIGSSVAEQTEKREQNERETLREILEPGQILQYRNPNLQVGVIKRVNKKSVRIIRPNEFYPGTKPMSDEPEPEYRKETEDLDPKWLTLIKREDYDEQLETVREYHEDIPADYDAAVEFLSGGEVEAY